MHERNSATVQQTAISPDATRRIRRGARVICRVGQCVGIRLLRPCDVLSEAMRNRATAAGRRPLVGGTHRRQRHGWQTCGRREWCPTHALSRAGTTRDGKGGRGSWPTAERRNRRQESSSRAVEGAGQAAPGGAARCKCRAKFRATKPGSGTTCAERMLPVLAGYCVVSGQSHA